MSISSRVILPMVLCHGLLLAQQPVLSIQQSGTTALFQAVSVSAANPDVVWISGHAATWARTTDGGRTWRSQIMSGRDSLQFRDLHAIDANRAWLMAAGNGEKSGIFQTRDGGATWSPVFINRDSSAFYDCMAFWDDEHGFAYSDAVKGRMPIVRTENGRDWTVSTIPAQDGEGGFAASGTCALATAAGDTWIGTGAGPFPRVLRSSDRGRTWADTRVPLVGGSGAGITGLAFRDRLHGVAVGGVISGTATGPRAARTSDGGATWTLIPDPAISGAVYGAAYGMVGGRAVLIVVGPSGAAYSLDDGDTWAVLDAAPYWSVGFAGNGTAWLVGPKGRVVRVDWR
jgi:photosystem II stability/assembly factor-like uncharacterized protein